MNIEETIKRYSNNAEYARTLGSLQECLELKQLAEWLRELKDYRARIPSYETGYNDAKREIALSGEYERAYERGKSDAEQTRWIPVSERLPDTNDDVLVYDGADMYVAWYSEKGMWQGWNSHDNSFERNTPIIAWMPLPEPYREVAE